MSNIEWTDVTWNPVIGCTPVSPGCLNCYAASMAIRLQGMGRVRPNGYEPRGLETARGKVVRIAEVRNGRAVFTGDVRCLPDRLNDPMWWRKPRMVFVNSMSDLFHEGVPFEFVDRVFAVMSLCQRHTFQVLTKRPERMEKYLLTPGRMKSAVGQEFVPDHEPHPWPLPNVWLGTSVERQQEADERIPHLLRCPAAVRFLSCEPLLGPIDLTPWIGSATEKYDRSFDRCPIQWVIVGGESGPGARPCDVEWIRSIIKQCCDAGVPCFVKQLGARIMLRNDSHSDWPREGDGLIYDHDAVGWLYQGEKHEARLHDPKGGNPEEWPEDLQVREWPL